MNKITKKQLKSLIESKGKIIKMLAIITLISMWIKIGLNTSWHFSDVTVETIVLFVLILMGILSNVRNNFPIFNSRKYNITEEFSYSVTLFFTVLFIFMIYKNIVEPDFIAYIAELSFHDLCTLVVFLCPVAFITIEIINIGFIILGKKKITKKDIKIYDEETERVLSKYKVLTIKTILIIMLLSIWIKVGLNSDFTLQDVLYELISLLLTSVIFIIENIKSKLPPFYSFRIKIDKYLIGSILLPYLLIVIYALISKDFRTLILSYDSNYLISFIVYIAPIFLIPSLVFYIGIKHPNILKDLNNNKNIKNNKIKYNAVIALIITIIIMALFILYTLAFINNNFSLENILQLIIIFIPLVFIIFLIIFSGIKEINK